MLIVDIILVGIFLYLYKKEKNLGMLILSIFWIIELLRTFFSAALTNSVISLLLSIAEGAVLIVAVVLLVKDKNNI